jgi:HAD superfamily hydrolase (TIGR01509 family)
MILRGAVQTGRREAAGFLSVPWVDQQIRNTFGLTPYPGTLNLRLADPDALARWNQLQRSGYGQLLRAPEGSGSCSATGYRVAVNGQVQGAVLLPGVEGYPPDVLEVVAVENLRHHFGLVDGDSCRLLVREDCGSRFNGVLFDLEGTLVDFQWQLAQAEDELRAAVGTLGFEPALFADDSYAGIRRRALELAPSSEERLEIDRRLGPIYDRYDQDALSRWSLREGARELLGDLKGCGLHTGLVSNIGHRAVTGALEKFGLEDLLKTIVTRNHVSQMKPDGDGIRRAMATLGLQAGATLMVGDSLSDLGAARDAGVSIAIVAGGESSPADVVAAGPDHQLQRLAQVADLV